MGLLAPLYALAAIAVAGPIVFHLIRRQPQGQMQFSSLMFLQPSPPRLTRRSRIDNWLLLLLRAIALILIALAFARPYLRETNLMSVDLTGRNILLLLDTSASMKRPGVSTAVASEAEEILAGLSDKDRVALYTIDERLNELVPLQWDTDGITSQQAVRAALADATPTWRSTDLSVGLTAAADLLNANIISGKISSEQETEIVLISDLQTEAGLEKLQGFPWPEAITLDVRRVLAEQAGNARTTLMVADDAEDDLRIRIENNEDSSAQAFDVAWSTKTGPIESTRTRVQVPAGQVRVVAMRAQPSGADRVTLFGDAWPDDNATYAIPRQPAENTVLFVGKQQAETENDLGYFLQQAPLSTPLINRTVERIEVGELSERLADEKVRAIVLEADAGLLNQVEAVRKFARDGGTVVLSLAQPVNQAAWPSQLVGQILGEEGVDVTDARVKDFAMIGNVNYQHPVFAPFSDPRFNDFSKIRIWQYRKIELPNDTSTVTVASLDSEAPLMLQSTVDQGSVWIWSCGWQPTSSGIALSSKFLPILLGILDPDGSSRDNDWSYSVGEALPWDSGAARVVLDDGSELDEEAWEQASDGAIRIYQPGVFRIENATQTAQVAIQLAPPESRVTPQDIDVFEEYGVGMAESKSTAERADLARQMKVEELEASQRLWQWLLLVAIVILAVETLLAGWSARQTVSSSAATG